MPKEKVILKLCTLLKGEPYGPAYIEFTHKDDPKGISNKSFRGVGVFD